MSMRVKDEIRDREKIKITADFARNATIVSVADTRPFATYEGITTSGGYAKISNEIVQYSGITNTSGNSGTLTIISRGDLTPSSSVLDTVEEKTEDTPEIPENNN